MNTHEIPSNSDEANKQSPRNYDVRRDRENQFATSVRLSSRRLETRSMNPRTPWKDGVLLMMCNLLVAIGNYAFQGLIGRKLSLPEYGYANAAAGAVLLLSLPVMATSNALIHYVARFRASGRRAELHGLVSSTRKWLGFILGGGFLLALLLIRPLTEYCGFPRTSLIAVMVINMVAVLGTVFVAALCTGMGWYARLGFMAVCAVIAKLATVWIATSHLPIAECAIASTAASALVYSVILRWRKEVSGPGKQINPWNREFGVFALAALASALGSYGFTQSDVLIAQRNFPPEAVAHFCAAGVFARALLGLTGPLLMVLFATRSAAERQNSGFGGHAVLIGVYLAATSAGAVIITIFSTPLTHSIFGHAEPATAALASRFALLMVIVGAIEVLGNWALASRWFNVVYAQFAISILYVAVGLRFGTNPANLLTVLLVGAVCAFLIVLGVCGFNFVRLKARGEEALPTVSLEPMTS
jgi:O-antigen/teichoic acid export membrane protein